MKEIKFMWACLHGRPIDYNSFDSAYASLLREVDVRLDAVNDGKKFRSRIESEMLEKFRFIELEIIPDLVDATEACGITHADKWRGIWAGIFQISTNYKNQLIKTCKKKPNVDLELLLEDEKTLTHALTHYANLFIYIKDYPEY